MTCVVCNGEARDLVCAACKREGSMVCEVWGVVGLICAMHAWKRAVEAHYHARTQDWLDEFMGQAAQGQIDMMITMVGAQGVTGLICALEAWHRWWADREGYRRGLLVGTGMVESCVGLIKLSGFERQMVGVTGLIAAIYAWREWMLFFNPACRRCCITLATYRCHTCGYDRRLDA